MILQGRPRSSDEEDEDEDEEEEDEEEEEEEEELARPCAGVWPQISHKPIPAKLF